jgi:spore germination protein KC
MVVASLVLFLTGCWDQQEITQLAIIRGMGFDLASDPHTVRVSVQISPTTVQTPFGGAGGIGGSRLRVVTIEVESPSEFFVLLQGQLRREPFLLHLNFIAFGEEFARSGIDRVLSGIQGIQPIRGSVPVFVAAGKAEDMLKAHSGIGREPGQDVVDLLSTIRDVPVGRQVTFNEALNTLSAKGSELVLPILELTPLRLEPGDERASESEGGQGGGKPLQEVVISRTALFSQDKWVSELDPFVTQNLNLLIGGGRSGALTVPSPGSPGDYIAVQYERFRPRFNFQVIGDRQVELTLSVRTSLRVIDSRGYDISKMGFEPIHRAVDTVLAHELTAFIHRLQQEGIDAVGFGQMIYRSQPRTWSRLEPLWEEIFPAISVKVEVQSRVVSTSLIHHFFQIDKPGG